MYYSLEVTCTTLVTWLFRFYLFLTLGVFRPVDCLLSYKMELSNYYNIAVTSLLWLIVALFVAVVIFLYNLEQESRFSWVNILTLNLFRHWAIRWHFIMKRQTLSLLQVNPRFILRGISKTNTAAFHAVYVITHLPL